MIEKLEYLIALAREQHFGRAAVACGVTQSTLSTGLRQLEEILGVMLVQRGSRFHSMTPEGARALEWARRIVADARAMREDVRAGQGGLAGQLRIGVVPSALPFVAGLTTPYRAEHPGVTFTVLSRTSAEIATMLDNLQIDAGLTYVGPDAPARARLLPLYEERYCLVLPAPQWQGGVEATWQDVARIPICLLTQDMQNRRIIQDRLARHGITPMITLESDSMLVLLTHLRTGAWASVMPNVMAKGFDFPEEIRTVPIGETEPLPLIGLTYGRRDPVTPLVRALLEHAAGLRQV